MNFKLITLRKENGTILEFKPENIHEIIFDKDIVILYYWQEDGIYAFDEIILKKEDYAYPHWDYFIKELTRTFEIEGFKIEL